MKLKPTPPHPFCIIYFSFMKTLKKFNLDLRNFREPFTHDKKTSNYGLQTVIEHYFFELNCHLNVKTQHLKANLKQK